MNFDEILHFLNELGHGELFEIPIDFDPEKENDSAKIQNFMIVSRMKEKILKIELNNCILDVLDKEYQEVIVKVEEKIMNVKKKYNNMKLMNS